VSPRIVAACASVAIGGGALMSISVTGTQCIAV
jgi:hypothetical protein